MKSIDSSFYKSSAWNKCRKSYLDKVNGLCERCLSKGLIVPAKIVHHKIFLNQDNVKDPSIALCHDNLEALCQECHNKIHIGKEKPNRRYEIVDGELIITEG